MNFPGNIKRGNNRNVAECRRNVATNPILTPNYKRKCRNVADVAFKKTFFR